MFKYIDIASAGKTKDYVRALGVKSKYGSLFLSGDITKLIKSDADDITLELLSIVRKVMNMKKKSSSNP
jgi:hypothetical protein